MASIALIRPLCADDEPEFSEPLGIERLAGFLIENGVAAQDVLLLDRRLYREERRAGFADASSPTWWDDLTARFPPHPSPSASPAPGEPAASDAPGSSPALDFAGVSIMSADEVPDALQIISRIHAYYPNTSLLVGGLYVTTNQRDAQKRFPAYVTFLAGEGEQNLLDLMQGKHPQGTTLPPDTWAFAYRPLLERYVRLGCAVSIQTSRGCVGSCTFCATPCLPPTLSTWCPRDISLVASEIAHLSTRLANNHVVAGFNIVDDDFGPVERIESLVDALQNRRIKAALTLEMRLSHLASCADLAARLRRLRDAGLVRLFIGLESLNPATLRKWSKPLPLGLLPFVVDALQQSSLEAQFGYILWHKDSTIKSVREEVTALRSLGIYSHRAALSTMIVFPGSALANSHVANMPATNRGSSPATTPALELPTSTATRALRERFITRSSALTSEWTAASLRLPEALSRAYLTGDYREADELRDIIRQGNERSYRLFMELLG